MRMVAYMKTESVQVQTLVLFHYDAHDPIDHYAGHACRQERKCVWSCLVCHSIRRARDTARRKRQKTKAKDEATHKESMAAVENGNDSTCSVQRAGCAGCAGLAGRANGNTPSAHRTVSRVADARNERGGGPCRGLVWPGGR